MVKIHMPCTVRILPFLLLFFVSYKAASETIRSVEVSGVPVEFEEVIFPKYWQDEGDAECEPYEDRKLQKLFISSIQRGISKYPKRFIKLNLKQIYSCKSISIFQHKYAGTKHFETKSLFFGRNYIPGETPDWEKTFHHELSSLWLINYGGHFPKKSWIEINDKGLNSYRSEGESFTKSFEGNISLSPELSYLDKGFIVPYGETNFENDINTFAALIMTEPETVRELSEKHPKICKKAELTASFLALFRVKTALEYLEQRPDCN